MTLKTLLITTAMLAMTPTLGFAQAAGPATPGGGAASQSGDAAAQKPNAMKPATTTGAGTRATPDSAQKDVSPASPNAGAKQEK